MVPAKGQNDLIRIYSILSLPCMYLDRKDKKSVFTYKYDANFDYAELLQKKV